MLCLSVHILFRPQCAISTHYSVAETHFGELCKVYPHPTFSMKSLPASCILNDERTPLSTEQSGSPSYQYCWEWVGWKIPFLQASIDAIQFAKCKVCHSIWWHGKFKLCNLHPPFPMLKRCPLLASYSGQSTICCLKSHRLQHRHILVQPNPVG